MRKLILLLTVLALALFAASCSDDDAVSPEPPNDVTEGDQLATAAFDDLQDVIVSLDGMTPEQLRNVSFANVRSGFEDALEADADNAIANLGLAILEILELNYDKDLWGLFDDLDGYLNGSSPAPATAAKRHRTLFGRQFSLVVEVPFAMTLMRGTTFPTTVTIGNIQNLISTKVMPALRRSLGHLAVAEGHSNPVLRIQIEDEGVMEWIKIDKAEIYLFDASVRALAAAFGMMIAYDMDFFGPDGSYGWVDDLRAFEDWKDFYFEEYLGPTYGWASIFQCPLAEFWSGATGDTLEATGLVDYHIAMEESLMLTVGYHNVENRPAFLTLKNNALGAAHEDLLTMLSKMDASADFIRNHRENENEENLIKLTDLTDFDSDITNNLNDINFARDFTKVEDMIGFFRDLLSGPYTFTEAIGSGGQDFTWQMDFGALFGNPISDLKTKLPYHKWMIPQQGPWLAVENTGDLYSESLQDETIGLNVWNGEACVHTEWDGVDYYSVSFNVYSLPIEDYFALTDESGQVIPSDEFPYLPDYTFNGFLPGWDRAKWLELKDRL